MSAEFFDTKPEFGSIIYPENEALRYVIREQREEIDRLKSENERLKTNRCPDCGNQYDKNYNQRFHEKTCRDAFHRQLARTSDEEEIEKLQSENKRLEDAVETQGTALRLNFEKYTTGVEIMRDQIKVAKADMLREVLGWLRSAEPLNGNIVIQRKTRHDWADEIEKRFGGVSNAANL
jgi:hypothetical protein